MLDFATIEKNVDTLVGGLRNIDTVFKSRSDTAADMVEKLYFLTVYSVGDEKFQPLYQQVVDIFLDKGGKEGVAIIEQLEDRIGLGGAMSISPHIAADAKRAGIFQYNEPKFQKNFRQVQGILNKSLQKRRDKNTDDYRENISTLLKTSKKSLREIAKDNNTSIGIPSDLVVVAAPTKEDIARFGQPGEHPKT